MIPELKLFNLLEVLTELLVDDLKTMPTDEETILYQILGTDLFRDQSYFDIAKELFLRSNENPRQLELNYSFSLERASVPSLSLSTPQENPDQALNSVGVGEEDEYITKEGPDSADVHYPIYNRHYKASVNVVVSSSNFMEQTILYHVYRSLLIAAFPQLELDGFTNVSLAGREVQINPELIPTNLYVRTLTLNFSYTVAVQGLVAKQIITKFCEGGPTQIINSPI